MSVLFLDNSWTFGGSINALAHLLSAIRDEELAPVVVSGQPMSFLDDAFPRVPHYHWPVRLHWADPWIHQRVIRLPGFARGPLRILWDKGRTIWWLLFKYFPEALWLARIGRKHGVELVHLNNGCESMVSGLMAARILGVPAVSHQRGDWNPARVTTRLYARIPRKFIAVSRATARNTLEGGADPGRLVVIHDAVDLSEFAPKAPPSRLRDELGLPPGAKVFAIFGRIVDWKGVLEFVRAARIVIDRVPDSFGLVVGDHSDGSESYVCEVRDLARELGLDGRLLFTGYRRDVPDVMRACDVVVHCSIEPEPFGMTVIEAMALGKPVVAANSGGPLETVLHGETGLLVDPKDAAALAEAISGLLSDPSKASEMGRRGAARARDHFGSERYLREVMSVYRSVLE